MIDFVFHSPTKIYFGHHAEDRLGEALREFSFRRVLLIYGSGSIKKSGLYQKVLNQLDGASISHEELPGIRPNPRIEDVRKGVSLARSFQPDVLLAVGGGSVIDTAKSIAVSYYYEGDPFDFNLQKAVPQKALPIGVILTISSAGSELSDSCVISNDPLKIKRGFNNDIVRPVFAIEDPELTYSVPQYQKAAGISDIMMHSLERYHSASGNDQLADDFALVLVKNTMKVGLQCLKNPTDYEVHATIMLDSSLSHNGLTNIGKAKFLVVHALEHVLSAYNPSITHGAGVALLYPAWAAHIYKEDLAKFARLGRELFEIKSANDEEAAIIGIRSMKEYFHSIGMPTSFQEVGIAKEDLPSLVALATGNGTRTVGLYPRPLEKKDVEAIYESLLA
ncbi:MAG: iron-containing alcohol dehydrogenase [Bacilli bacterium]|nr:iron-containing alcohol dehydrogenase [Bacilli bacterium]